MSMIDRLPHQPPMRLLGDVDDLVPGDRCRARRETRSDDFFFQGHFPGCPVVPACILIEMIAQAGGLAAGISAGAPDGPVQLRVAAFGPCKFPAAAVPGDTLIVDARVRGHIGGLYKITGEVRAADELVATGEVTLSRIR